MGPNWSTMAMAALEVYSVEMRTFSMRTQDGLGTHCAVNACKSSTV